VVGRQPNASAAFTLGEIPGTHFNRLSRSQGTWFCRGYHGKTEKCRPNTYCSPRNKGYANPLRFSLYLHCLSCFSWNQVCFFI